MSRQKLIHLHGVNTPSKEVLAGKGFAAGEIAVKTASAATESELYVLGGDKELAVFATKTYLENFAKSEAQKVENALTGLTNGAVATLRSDLNTLSGTVDTLSATVETNRENLQGQIVGLDDRMGTAEDDILDLKKIRNEFADADTALENKLTSAYTAAVAAEAELREQGDADTLATATAYTDTQVAAEAGLRDAADKVLEGTISTLDTKVNNKVTELEGKIAEAKAAATTTVVEGTDTGNNMTIVESAGEGGSKVFTVNLTDVASAETLGDVKGRVDTLVGSDANKSVRTIANEELAAQLLGEEVATDNFKTLQELAAWLEGHPEEAAEMNAAIQANATAITANANAITAETEERKAEITRVEKLVTGNTNSLQGEIDAVEGRMDTAEADIDALQSATTANATAIQTNAGEIARVEREYKAETADIRADFAAADSQIRNDFAAADNQIRLDFASADTATLNSAKAYADEQVAAEAKLRDDADKVLQNAINGVKTTADTAVQEVEVSNLQGVEAVKGDDNVVTIDCAEMVINCGTWE